MTRSPAWMTRKLIVLLIALSLIGCLRRPSPALDLSDPEHAFPPELVAQIDDHVAQKLSDVPLVGLVVAVSDGSHPVFIKGYGVSDREASQPTEIDTVYRIGSISKMFTAAAILKLAEAGEVTLDDPISRFFPELPGATDEITVRHLLNHTSGLPGNDALLAQMEIDPYATYTSEALYGQIEAIFRTFDPQPTEVASYSNVGYRLLALLIEEVTGRAYGVYLDREILRPLGLERTRHCTTPPAPMAEGYRVIAGEVTPIEGESMSLLMGSGSLCSTARELIRWHHGLSHGDVIAPSSYEQMLAPTASRFGPRYAYGLGVELYREKGETIQTGHGGAVYGFTSILRHYVEEDVTVVILTNTTPPMRSMDVLSELAGLIQFRHAQHFGTAE